MDQQDPKQAPVTPFHVAALTGCAVELEQLSPESRGRVLRALVELYRADFETKQPATRLGIGQFATGQTMSSTDWLHPRYGGQ